MILSGTGSDGTLGLAEVKAAGGITFAQSTESAKFDGMPKSAIASGCRRLHPAAQGDRPKTGQLRPPSLSSVFPDRPMRSGRRQAGGIIPEDHRDVAVRLRGGFRAVPGDDDQAPDNAPDGPSIPGITRRLRWAARS